MGPASPSTGCTALQAIRSLELRKVHSLPELLGTEDALHCTRSWFARMSSAEVLADGPFTG